MQDAAPQIDETERAAWTERILAAQSPSDTLLQALEHLDAAHDPATQAALFESVLWRIDVRHYWVFLRMARVYAELGRDHAGFMMTAQAVQMRPEWDASHAPLQQLFQMFARRGQARAALDVFVRHLGLHPGRSIAEPHAIEQLRRALASEPQRDAPAPPAAGPAPPAAPPTTHRVTEAEQRPAAPVRIVGDERPRALARLSEASTREPIDVVELQGGELLVCHDAVVVRDAAGRIREDLSLGAQPELLAGRVLNPGSDEAVEQHDVAEAVLIVDAFTAPNIGHYLLDQIARLELYRRAGADLTQALVVGPELRTAHQRALAARCGLSRPLGTARLARVRARRLWISTDCRALQHPAHLGAGWAIEHARAVLGGRGAAGTRRLFLSRPPGPGRLVRNESELVGKLARFGVEAIHPGAMAYEDQLAAFRAASHVVAPHGTPALAHIVACAPGTRILELFHPLHGTASYAMLATECRLDYAAACGRDLPSQAADQPGRAGERQVHVDPALVRRWLDAPA